MVCVGRSAFISRRDGRYLFRARLPACLMPGSRSAFRISLRTADYKVAVVRAARIASWMLNVKAAEDPKAALLALWPRLQAVAVEPVRDEADLVERRALQYVAFDAQFLTRHAGLKPNDIAPGWDEHFVALLRENSRAASVCEKAATVEGQLERRRAEYARQARPVVVRPPERSFETFGGLPEVNAAENQPGHYVRRPISEVLEDFLTFREGQDGDRRAESEVAPIVRFVRDLLGDPAMIEMNGRHLLQIRNALPNIPTRFGFSPSERDDLHFRWNEAQKNGWTRQRNGEAVHLKRPTVTTLTSRYEGGLTAFWQFAIDQQFAYGPVPNFKSSSPLNPPPAERDALRSDEIFKLCGSAPFTGCHSIARCWTPGNMLVQGAFYWGQLIELLCGMRPGEIAQLRCRDVLELNGRPHFRYARFSVAQEKENQFAPKPGGNRGKTPAAFRWVTIHWVLLRLGIVDRRDAIVESYVERKIGEGGGREKFTAAELAVLSAEAYEQWLFPDWKVYVKKTGEIKWAHSLTKAFTYGAEKLEMHREGLVQYSARHTYKGFVDDLRGLSERSRLILFGHSTKKDVSSGYGPKQITEEQAEIAQKLSNRAIWRMALILIRAKRKAERGELKTVEAWRIDERGGDAKFQAAMKKRALQYR
jgi:integrase